MPAPPTARSPAPSAAPRPRSPASPRASVATPCCSTPAPCAHLPPLREPVVADHFETFVACQLDALGLATAVGHDSWFLYAVEPAPHRRGGRLTPAQRRLAARRARPRPPKRSVLRSFQRMLEAPGAPACLPGPGCTCSPTITRPTAPAVARHPAAARIDHRAYPNPPRGPKGSPRSAAARARDAALFPVDLLHALWRHSCAHHRRETIAFARRINAAVERGYLMAVWRNFVKGRSERKPDRTTPAMRLGLAEQPWNWPRVLARRLFATRACLAGLLAAGLRPGLGRRRGGAVHAAPAEARRLSLSGVEREVAPPAKTGSSSESSLQRQQRSLEPAPDPSTKRSRR